MSTANTAENALSKTQRDLLRVLRVLRESAEASEHEANARALGGLADHERFGRMAMHDGRSSYYARKPDGGWAAAHCVKIDTFRALRDRGLVEHLPGYGFRAR